MGPERAEHSHSALFILRFVAKCTARVTVPPVMLVRSVRKVRSGTAPRRFSLGRLIVGVVCASSATATPIPSAEASTLPSSSEVLQHQSIELDRLLTRHIPNWSDTRGALEAAAVAVAARSAHTPAGPLAETLSHEATKLEVASSIVAAAESDSDSLSLAVSAVRAVTRLQGEYLGASFPAPSPREADPASAALMLAERHNVDLTPDQRGRVLALDGLPDQLRSAVGSVLAAYMAFDELTREAYAGVDPARLDEVVRATNELRPDDVAQDPDRRDWLHPSEPEQAGPSGTPVERFAELGIDLGPAMAARGLLLDAVVSLREAASTRQAGAAAVPPIDLCPALTINLEISDDVYSQDCFLLVDAGGNDVYYNNAGGNGVNAPVLPCRSLPGLFGAAALVDLEGDDRYDGGSRNCGQGGGGYLGSGFLVDLGDGDSDVYAYGDYGTSGGGYLGSGLLLDAGGSANQIRGGSVATNGGGFHGGGFLYDGASSNQHIAGNSGTNGGGSWLGIGADISTGTVYSSYSAGDLGTNGGGCQGSGLLINLGDDDGGGITGGRRGTNGGGRGDFCVYTRTTPGSGLLVASQYGNQVVSGDNGYGELLGVGMLVGGTGDAGYSGGNGGGYVNSIVERALGFLVDPAGNDGYEGTMPGGNGGSWIGGAGVLVDMAGNDHYSASSCCGVNGGGGGGSGFLLDAAGNDIYFGSSYGSNGGGYVGGSGFLHDLAGNDRYSAGTCGVNGGGPTPACSSQTASSGTLLDDAGDDSYSDGDGGTGQNKTVALKGTVGRQIDIVSTRSPSTVGQIAFNGTATLPTFPCPPPPPFGTGPCSGSFAGDWSADISGMSGTSVFHAAWATTTGTALDVAFQYSEWQCLTATESLLGLAVGGGTATAVPGQIQGKWQQPNETFARDVVGATMTFDFQWTRVLGNAVLTLEPVSLVLDVAGLGPKVVVDREQTGIATFALTSTGNTTVPTCSTPLTDVEGAIAGSVSLIA